MDILFVRSLFRPADFGGNRYPWEVTRRLALRGHAVRVVTPRPSGPLPGPTPVELIYYPVSRRTPLETFLTNAVFSRRAVARELRRRPADVIVLSSYDVAFGHYAWRDWRAPSVYIYHSSFYSDAVNRLAQKPWPLRLAHRPLDAFVKSVETLTFRHATRIVAVSPFSRMEIARRLGAADERVWLIPTGIDTEFFRRGDRTAARERLGLPADARILLTVGRLARVKRYDRAIEAVALLGRQGERCVLIVAGTGPEQADLQAKARELAVDARFPGFVDGAALRDHYQAADLGLCTSDFENWSLSILESLACGTPMVGTPGGSIPDLLGLIDPSLVVPSAEPGAIAATVADQLAHQSRLAEIAERARRVVAERFGWDRTVTDLERCLASAITDGPALRL